MLDAARDANAFSERRMALVGGQALYYWAWEYRETSFLKPHDMKTITSDVDFTGSADEAEPISKAIGGHSVVRRQLHC